MPYMGKNKFFMFEAFERSPRRMGTNGHECRIPVVTAVSSSEGLARLKATRSAAVVNTAPR
ncbi:hypothetical protein PPTG_22255 [Phytophthora nicotianae INRA-310]|uniref:Uncharacterized protein n=2 Tax=Phytophthora nicotianae (strain INRA-310) TaxID=761204 RepID=W2QL27_PHYN3|nr:hypothetical protein PPTG_22255 [Phytophthora nicotianae INRA-310]ETN13828.1 hypothetical protein PPTG_22255 [Phytophthora nicotianae INRA-310]